MNLLFDELEQKYDLSIFNNNEHNNNPDNGKLTDEINYLFRNLAGDKNWSFANLSRKSTSYASHNYHRYPAKFIPQLARKCILEYTKKDNTVCDPFMGCGTTIVESLIYQRKVLGIDINPVAKLITKAKSIPIEPQKLERRVEYLLKELKYILKSDNHQQNLLHDNNIKPIIPSLERINYWFPDENIRREIGIILGKIDDIKESNIRNFCRCAFSHILKNSSIWLMKSTKPTRNFSKDPTPPFSSFKRHINKMLRSNRVLYKKMPNKVINNIKNYLTIEAGDSRNLPIGPNNVDLIVTSPPYVTSYEYADLHQLTALWFSYTKSVQNFREGFIGSVYTRKDRDEEILSEIAKNTVKELGQKSKRISKSVNNYFLEMQQSFKEMYRVLKPKANACIVIGNTQLKKVPILNAEIYIEIMINLNFAINKIIKRRIPSKILPQTRDSKTGRFTSKTNSDRLAYAYEYIIIMEKKG